MTEEEKRLQQERERTAHWNRWGPYMSERAWGTVREDYSPHGTAWDYLPHDQARSKAYRWNEDGIAGISDRHQLICFALTLWNGHDPILKERLFGLSGPQGNHGEDVKEYYYYLDSTPTHSYMKYLYKYPQQAYPYEDLVRVNAARGKDDPEYELLDTGVFDEDRYFDVFVEYAKASPEDVLIQVTAINRGPDEATIHLIPTIWFRNNWCWGYEKDRPSLERIKPDEPGAALHLEHRYYGSRWFYADNVPEMLFTGNETNYERLNNAENSEPFLKDAFHEYIVGGKVHAINGAEQGTKAAAHYTFSIPSGGTASVRLRLTDSGDLVRGKSGVGDDFDGVFADRKREADEFYATVIPAGLTADTGAIMRQALGGLLWSKQYYHYVVEQWLKGDPAMPTPPAERLTGRNHQWRHLFCSDVISMPDKWEYPWFAAWDLAFHSIPLSLVDSDFAKDQLLLMLREWYMH
ncbi:MAG: glucosidase, partial [Armatimonadota bacterium]|nr:glucosidase [Armatimonadota bacterium]